MPLLVWTVSLTTTTDTPHTGQSRTSHWTESHWTTFCPVPRLLGTLEAKCCCYYRMRMSPRECPRGHSSILSPRLSPFRSPLRHLRGEQMFDDMIAFVPTGETNIAASARQRPDSGQCLHTREKRKRERERERERERKKERTTETHKKHQGQDSITASLARPPPTPRPRL